MVIDEEYEELRKAVLHYIPDTFTINNNLIEEQSYNATMLPINYNPYRMGGCYYPTFYKCTPRTFVGSAPVYPLTKGEETTIGMWNAMLKYREYDLLADLFILGFLHDNWETSVIGKGDVPRCIAGCIYTSREMKELWGKARDILDENRYDKHDPRCKTFLTIGKSDVYRKYRSLAWNNKLEIGSRDEFVKIMMEIIIDAYSSLYFIVQCPDDMSNEYARRRYEQALNRFYDDFFK